MIAYLARMDARGYITLASFVLVVVVLILSALYPDLRHDEFFKNIGVVLVVTCWTNGAIAWSYGTTKNGGELAQQNADIVKANAAASPPLDGTAEGDKLTAEPGK